MSARTIAEALTGPGSDEDWGDNRRNNNCSGDGLRDDRRDDRGRDDRGDDNCGADDHRGSHRDDDRRGGDHSGDERKSSIKARLAELAKQVERLRGGTHRPATRRTTGLPALDAALGGGIAGGAIHEFLARRDGSAVRSVALLVATSAAGRHGWVLYIDTTLDFYPPAAAQRGVPLERLLVVRAPRRRDALWVCEQALRCRAVAAVVMPLRQLNTYESRRLQLAAETGGGVGLLIRDLERRASNQARSSAPPGRLVSSPPLEHVFRASQPVSSRRDSARLARRFNAGAVRPRGVVPEGRMSERGVSVVPPGLRACNADVPRVETRGYSRSVPPARTLHTYPLEGVGRDETSGSRLGSTFAASRLCFDPLVGDTPARRLRVTVLKLREGRLPEPFILELPDAADTVSVHAVSGERPGAAQHSAAG